MIQYDNKYEWNQTSLTYGKFIGGFFYFSKPRKRFTLIWRLNHSKFYGEYWKCYNSIRAAEQAMKALGPNVKFSLVDELTKHVSHYEIGDKK